MLSKKSFKDYVFQDINLRFENSGFFGTFLRYFRLPCVRILINYRMTQFVRLQIGKGILYKINVLRLEMLTSRYLITLNDTLEVGPGLSFPHHGPFVINSGARIGKNCTIHPQVLIGGDRGKGCPTIGDNVFIGNGSKLIGNCHIGDWVFIAPGAIITKDIPRQQSSRMWTE